MTVFRLRTIPLACLACLLSAFASAQTPAVRARITAPVNEQRLVTLSGNTHPLVRASADLGRLPDSTPIRRMLLLLSHSPEQETALQKLLDDQQTPGSQHYRQWLTPEQFGEKFGPADSDIQAVTAWLGSHGFQIGQISPGKNVVEFSGTAGQVREAFHTQMHRFSVGGKVHIANVSDPQIPAALAPVVKGIASLNNFAPKPSAHRFGMFHRDPASGEVKPDFTVYDGSNTPYYAIGPADFGVIYNTNTLKSAGIDGRGETIAVVGDSNINLQDVRDFRNLFGLGAGNTSVVVDGPDPGIVPGTEFEALLDVEWANATAPGASVVLVTAQDTEASLGIEFGALYVVQNNLAGVLSVSFGYCEQGLGNTENQFIQSLWQQAAAQGITVVASSGDNGSAGCDDFNTATTAQFGLAVSGIASTPYNVAAGGTDFNGSGPAYWLANSAPGTLLSARSYIPELAWNNSCAATASAGNLNVCPAVPATGTPPDSLNILAGSGGPSRCSTSTGPGFAQGCQATPKPSWQSGTGVPNDGARDIPDISLFSAINSNSRTFYLVCSADGVQGNPSCQNNGSNIYFLGAGGTSVAAPTFAGIITLAEQKSGARLGNVNYLLYSLAAQTGSSCTSAVSEPAKCIFNDVVQGNISVPCTAGTPNCSVTTGSATGVLVDDAGKPAYSTQTGYDLATGLGSVNGANLVNAIAAGVAGYKASSASLMLNGATSQLTAKHGDPISVAVTVTPTAATGSVALLGSKGGIDDGSLSGGMATWSSRLFPGGNYNVTAHYAGDGIRGASDSNGVPVSITPEASQTFVKMVTFDLNTGQPVSYAASTASYGSPYIVRVDVADSAGSLSPAEGISSNCSNLVTSCPTGTVSLTANGAPLDGGSFPLNSRGLTEDFGIQLSPGSYTVNATYPGDASYNASTGSASLTITKAPTTTTVHVDNTTVQFGQLLNFNALVNSYSNGANMSGGINFLFDGVARSEGGDYGAPVPEPPYRYLDFATSDSFGAVGTHTLAAQYPGDNNYAGSNSDPVTVTVTKAVTTSALNISPNPGVPRAPVTLTFNVSSNAVYARTPATGTVTFYDNGNSIGTAALSSTFYPSATLSYTFTQLGTHNLTASYLGDGNYEGTSVTTPVQLTIQDQIPSTVRGLNVSLSPTIPGYPVMLQAGFSAEHPNSPALSGAVTFDDNGTPIPGTVSYSTINGAYFASVTYAFASVGSHNVSATYAGDVNYMPSTATLPNFSVVSHLQSTTTSAFLASTPALVNQPATIEAIVNGVAGGPQIDGIVTFLDNGTPLTGNVTVTHNPGSIQASLTTMFTTTGDHNITAEYGGDSNYATSQSPQALQFSVQGPLWVVLDNAAATYTDSGGSGTVFFNVYNNTASRDNITVSCMPDSSAATCSLSTNNLSISSHSNSYISFTLAVPANVAAVHPSPSLWGGTSAFLLCCIFMGTGLSDRRRRKALLLFATFALMSVLLSCGGGGGGGGVPKNPGGGIITPPAPKTYHFTISATDGTNTASQVFTATVQ